MYIGMSSVCLPNHSMYLSASTPLCYILLVRTLSFSPITQRNTSEPREINEHLDFRDEVRNIVKKSKEGP